MVYQQKLSGVMVQVAYPLYSRTTDIGRLRSIHERAARVHAAIIFPLQSLLIVLAPVLVPYVFGQAWVPAVVPTQVLAVAGMFAAVLAGYVQVMLAIGRPKPLLAFNAGRLALFAGVVLLASRHGLVTVAVAVVGAYFLILLGAYRLLLQRYVGISIGRLAPELGPALMGCAGMLAVSLPLMQMLTGLVPRLVQMILVATVGLCVYSLVLRVAFPSAWADAQTLVGQVLSPLARRFGRREPTAAQTDDVAASPNFDAPDV